MCCSADGSCLVSVFHWKSPVGGVSSQGSAGCDCIGCDIGWGGLQCWLDIRYRQRGGDFGIWMPRGSLEMFVTKDRVKN